MKKTILFALLLNIVFCSQIILAETKKENNETKETIVEKQQEKKYLEKITDKKVDNFYKISDNVYRSRQPTKEGFEEIEKMGIKTIINLRDNHDDKKHVAKNSKLQLKRVKIKTWKITDKHVIEVMTMLTKSEDAPFLIHCQHGADRTGLMSAMYRILFQNWTKEEALKELRSENFGFHSIWRNIPKYIENVDIEELRKKIPNLPAPTPSKK